MEKKIDYICPCCKKEYFIYESEKENVILDCTWCEQELIRK